MSNLKKTALAVLAFGSSAVFAGTMGPVCTPGSVTVPCESTAWDFGAQALYLKPSYAGMPFIGSDDNATTESYLHTPNNWGWGFQIEGSYHFNTGNDLDVNWYHWNKATTNGPYASFDSYEHSVDLFTTPTITARPRWDAVNIEFGQHVDFGEMSNVRFHGGFQYGHVAGSANVADALTTQPALYDSSTYNGFGPRVGADLSYDWGNGLGMFGDVAAAMLVGTQKVSRSVNAAALAAGIPNASGSTTTVIPELDAKVGLTYTYAMAQGDLTADVGWMFVNYFNAVHQPTFLGGTVNTDFALQGVYFGLKWVGNVV